MLPAVLSHRIRGYGRIKANTLRMYILLVILFLLLIVIYKKRKFFILSPVDFFIFYFIAVLISTSLYHFYYPKKLKFNFYNLDFIGQKEFVNTIFLFTKMTVLFMIGVILYMIVAKGYQKINSMDIRVIDVKSVKIDYQKLKTIGWALLIVGLILVYIDNGAGFFSRSQYIPKKSSALKTIFQNLFIVLSVISGIIYKKERSVALFFIVMTTLVGIGLGSRTASIYIILFGLFVSLFIESRQKRMVFFALFIPFIVLFFGFNLSLRSEAGEHGLIPYMGILVNKPIVIFEYVLSNIYYTLIFGFYDTVKTIEQYKIATIKNLITCLSPLPGAWTNWPQLGPKLRTYEPLPYTAIGEMSKFPIFSIFYYIVLGFYFAYIDKTVKTLIINKKQIFAIVQFLLLAMYVVHSFEYNLRSTHRFFVYSVFLMLIWFVVGKYKFVIKSSPRTT